MQSKGERNCKQGQERHTQTRQEPPKPGRTSRNRRRRPGTECVVLHGGRGSQVGTVLLGVLLVIPFLFVAHAFHMPKFTAVITLDLLGVQVRALVAAAALALLVFAAGFIGACGTSGLTVRR